MKPNKKGIMVINHADISNARSHNTLDWVPPVLLTYATAVVLSIMSNMGVSLGEWANAWSALKAACSSNSFIWRELSVFVVSLLQTAPYPSNEASEQITIEGSSSVKDLLLTFATWETHQLRFEIAPSERFWFFYRIPLPVSNLCFSEIVNYDSEPSRTAPLVKPLKNFP